jgi:ABC-type transporter Mla subunit MlaD
LVALTLIVFFAPNVARLLQPSIRIVALMYNAGALKDNAGVWIAGHPVGLVESVRFRGARSDSTERIAVTLRIPRKYASLIRTDSEARITSQRLIGRPVVDIAPGSPAAAQLGDMDSIRVQPRGTFEGVMDKAELLNHSFDALFAEMRAARKPAERRVADLDRLERQFSASVEGMKDLVDALEDSPIGILSGPEFKRAINNLSAHGQNLTNQLQSAASRARAAHNDARPALERLASRTDTISSILTGIKTQVTQTGGGLLLRAQRDSAIVAGLHEARVQLDSLIAQTKRNPLRFWF